jgi:hypothetical protein
MILFGNPRCVRTGRVSRWLCALLLLAPASARAEPADADRPVVRVVYFIPADRKPEPDYRARLDRVMADVQRFYRLGMGQNGHGEMTFDLDREPGGALRIHEVRGRGPMRDYGRNASDKVRREVREALAKEKLDIDRETVVIFQLLLEWRGDKAVEIGPYVGGGGPRGGTAWVYDDARLDARLLPSREPGGYYAGPCSLGQFNTHYIGGVAHELGHAFGLPHDCERDSDRPCRGLSLMGGGNHTYGQERRGEGKGAFLSPASALPLSVHPLFTGRRKPPAVMTCRLAELQAAHEGGALLLRGRLQGGPRAAGLVAHNDPQQPPGDYDAVGWACPVDAGGKFRLAIGELKPGAYDLRLTAYGEGGGSRPFAFRYRVDRERRPDLRPFAEAVWLQEAHAAFRAGNRERLAEIDGELKKQFPADALPCRKVEHLRRLLALPEPRSLAGVPPGVKEVPVADLKMESAVVGWGWPLRDQVLAEGEASCLLEVGGTFFASGLYAHAPARHVLRLDGQWGRFTTRYGLQDGHDGSVVFVVKGDGKELFRSKVVRDHTAREQAVAVANVTLLELVVEDAGDGAGSDWGVWLEPQLLR